MADNGFDPRDLPPPPFDLGMEETNMRVRADLDLEAVELSIAGKHEIVLSPIAAVDLVVRVMCALARLEARKDRGGE